MARRGQFKKGGGRVGHASHRRRRRRHHAVAAAPRRRHRAAAHRSHHRRRRHHGGGGVGLKHLAIAGGALAFLTGAASPVAAIKDNAAKLPGATTFGATAVSGALLLAVDKFVKPNKWLRAAGYAGIILAAAQVGNKGKDFKFLGDARQPTLRGSDEFDGDVEGVEVDDDEMVEGEDYDDED